MRINRVEFLQKLESVQPGLSPRDVLEQSACFVFRNGRVLTFNGEVACRVKSGLPKEFLGAVPAKPLLKILTKLPDEDMDVSVDGGHLKFVGGSGETGLVMDAEVGLPIDEVERPQDWKPLDENFCDAVAMVHECAGKDESRPVLTCVHVAPDRVEACDGYQLTRYTIDLDIAGPFLVRKSALKGVISTEATEISETDTWVHFRNPMGLVYSCVRSDGVSAFPDLGELIEVSGAPARLPKHLSEVAERAGLFSSENADEDLLFVKLKPGRMYVQGVGESGYHRKPLKIKYSGPKMSFRIAPKLLMEITKRHSECVVNADSLKVEGDRWVYVSSLKPPEDDKPKPEEGNGEGSEVDDGGEGSEE